MDKLHDLKTRGIWTVTLIKLPSKPTIHAIKDKTDMFARMSEPYINHLQSILNTTYTSGLQLNQETHLMK